MKLNMTTVDFLIHSHHTNSRHCTPTPTRKGLEKQRGKDGGKQTSRDEDSDNSIHRRRKTKESNKHRAPSLPPPFTLRTPERTGRYGGRTRTDWPATTVSIPPSAGIRAF